MKNFKNKYKSIFSIVSNGTESRKITGEATLESILKSGYMNVISNGHNYFIDIHNHGCEEINDLTYAALKSNSQSLYTITSSRFQLITAAAVLPYLNLFENKKEACVLGSGPVAIGAVLELQRIGFKTLTIISSNSTSFNWLKNLDLNIRFNPNPEKEYPIVIEATGKEDNIQKSLEICQEKGLLGILGSPSKRNVIDLYQLHRKSLNCIGMHELSISNTLRQEIFNDITEFQKKFRINVENITQKWKFQELQKLQQKLLNSNLDLPFNIVFKD
ncbi:MAG: hypothetical protein ACPGJV_13275 [Bacteriovoracaceae bacterium]